MPRKIVINGGRMFPTIIVTPNDESVTSRELFAGLNEAAEALAAECEAWKARAEKSEQQVAELKAREDMQTGSWNTLANCADTLRSRGFGTEFGAIDERVIAMAKALDELRQQK